MGRPPRAQAIRTERRRRDHSTLDRVHNLKLAIPSEFRDDGDHEYRWINDDNDRVQSLTQEDDWDFCQSSTPEATDKDSVRRQVGTKKTGEPLYAYLVRKRKDWYDEDKRKGSERNNKTEQDLLRRPHQQDGATAYVASGSSIRNRGGFAP